MGFTCRKEVRILLVGDRNVGKTSLILSLVSEEFPLDVPSKAEEITIPGDLTPEKVPTCIVDYSAVEQTDSQLETELRRSHVICIVYAVDDEDSLDSVTDHWLPFIRRTFNTTTNGNLSVEEKHNSPPVILVGNKVDLVDYSTMESVLPIMNDYEEIETCVECSARNLKNISEMFYFAQKAVLHPSAPLWNYNEKDLTDKCKRALGRVFKICDGDNDGLLSDAELANFQRRCFGMDLEAGTLDSLKAVVRKNCTDGIIRNGLTLKGFLTLHGLFIQRGRHETTWTILRKFGYGDDLSLHKDYLIPPLKIPAGCTAELSWAGYEFLTRIFEKYDQDRDGALSPQELASLFSTCPMVPWGADVYNTVVVVKSSKYSSSKSSGRPNNGWLGLPGFLGLWTLTTLLDTRKTLEHLAYLGYTFQCTGNGEETQLGALNITRDKRVDLAKKQTARSVYRCHVIGPRDAGKTTFCQGLLGRAREDLEGIQKEDFPRHTINTLQIYGQEKYLVLKDIDVRNVGDTLTPSELSCDVCCLLYDVSNPRSFEFIAKIYLRYFAGDCKIPVLIVGNKADNGTPVRQDFSLQPEAFCAKHRIPSPQLYSTTRSQFKKDIFVKLATMAAFPHLRQLGLVASDTGSLLKVGLGLALAALGGIFLIRVIRSSQS